MNSILPTTESSRKRLAAEATDWCQRDRWIGLELALVLAEPTGRRRGSFIALRWEGIDFSAGTIRWRAEYDKKGKEWVIPAPPELLNELRQVQRRLGAIGGRLFPRAESPSDPMPPEVLSQWLAAAARAGDVPKLDGGLWHPYCRGTGPASECTCRSRPWPMREAWKDVMTLARCYQHTDEATLLAVMSVVRKRSDRRVETDAVSGG